MRYAIQRSKRHFCRALFLSHLFATVFVLIPKAQAQTEMPVLKASSPNVQILDGDNSSKRDWILDPSIELDTYQAIRSDKNRTVVFKTDVDSRSFEVEPGRQYDFVILLNEKDVCKTRISTMVQGLERFGTSSKPEPVTIPITIEHGKLHLQGSVNGSTALDLIFDTGADTCVIYPSAGAKGVNLTFNDSVLNAGTGGVTLRQVSHDNRLEIADARWNHEPFIYVEKQADRADGIVGYTVFENRIVEIDYDRMLMIVHDSLPSHSTAFSKTAMPFAGSLPAVEIRMASKDLSCGGPFILDTGGTACMFVNQAFAAGHDLHRTLRKVGTGVSTGVGSGSIHSSQLMLPTLTIAGHSLSNVPIHVELPSDDNKALPGGVVYMDVLSRFNTILDFPAHEAYFKPNSHFVEPFRIRRSGPSILVVASIAVSLTFALAVVWYRKKGRG